MNFLVLIKLQLFILLFACIHLSYSKYTIYPLKPNSDIIGNPFSIQASPKKQLTEIAYQYRVAYDKLLAANPQISAEFNFSEQLVIPNQFILPKERKGIVINLAQLRLFYFPENQSNTVYTYPIAVGSSKHPTPELTTYIYDKRKNPTWTVPQSIINQLDNNGLPVPATARVQAGKHNPLGKYAMRLGESSYLIHGNNARHSIGQFVTHGCIRMYNKDIKELFSLVTLNTPVKIINETIQIGKKNNDIFLAIHKIPYLNMHFTHFEAIENKIKTELKKTDLSTSHVNWLVIEAMIDKHNSIPKVINSKQMGGY